MLIVGWWTSPSLPNKGANICWLPHHVEMHALFFPRKVIWSPTCPWRRKGSFVFAQHNPKDWKHLHSWQPYSAVLFQQSPIGYLNRVVVSSSLLFERSLQLSVLDPANSACPRSPVPSHPWTVHACNDGPALYYCLLLGTLWIWAGFSTETEPKTEIAPETFSCVVCELGRNMVSLLRLWPLWAIRKRRLPGNPHPSLSHDKLAWWWFKSSHLNYSLP